MENPRGQGGIFMPVPLRRFSCAAGARQNFWLTRARENFAQLLAPMRLGTVSVNGAPLHLANLERGSHAGRAQTCSAVAHATILGLFFLLAAQTRNQTIRMPREVPRADGILRLAPATLANLFGRPSLGRKGGGGEENPIPATRGNLATRAPIQLLAPHLPQKANPELPVPVTILDADAKAVTTVVINLGLPWMSSETDSAGSGKNHGIGTGPGHGMGDNDGIDAGRGSDARPYAGVVSWPVCSYCPDPSYSEEAQKEKIQGTVILRILVTAEGRTGELRVVKGLSRDLDERATQTVKGWRFTPAGDGVRRGVPVWMTVEVTYRLY
jgi:TonB family protein